MSAQEFLRGKSGKLLLASIAAVIVGGIYLILLQLTGNFHVVISGELYRSAQPTEKQLVDYVSRYGIKTVVNLRGNNYGSDWYAREIETTRRLGIEHVDFDMSAHEDMPQEKIIALVELLERAQKPVLIHCFHGADRTGLAVALYMAAVAHKGETAAEDQLSIRFGHFGIPFISSAYAMDRDFEKIEPWLGFSGS